MSMSMACSSWPCVAPLLVATSRTYIFAIPTRKINGIVWYIVWASRKWMEGWVTKCVCVSVCVWAVSARMPFLLICLFALVDIFLAPFCTFVRFCFPFAFSFFFCFFFGFFFFGQMSDDIGDKCFKSAVSSHPPTPEPALAATICALLMLLTRLTYLLMALCMHHSYVGVCQGAGEGGGLLRQQRWERWEDIAKMQRGQMAAVQLQAL